MCASPQKSIILPPHRLSQSAPLCTSPCAPQKECPTCQELRLAVEEAIRLKMSPTEIRRRKIAYAAHIQWMMNQRKCMESIVQMSIAGNPNVLVENSDKCGDACLYLPADYRKSADNVSLFQYRLSLQANVYAGRLFHLSLLLPNLVTGANFGIQSLLNGLVRMIQLGEISPSCRTFLRGVDGGSENGNLATLALNSTLCKERRFDVVQATRLPPSHSHHWLTDGLFSTIEGWMMGQGFAGCSTISELIAYLETRFSRADHYKAKRVEINILIVNFAYTKWFQGHINQTKVKRIGDPLVWKHEWVPEQAFVRVQFKYALSDTGTFEKDEWGPWEEKSVRINDPVTGEIRWQTVLRSDPAGIELMSSYPDTSLDPGVEPWKEDDEWKRDKVMSDLLRRWTFGTKVEDRRADWGQVERWHRAYPTSDTIRLVEDQNIISSFGGSAVLQPQLTWHNMWKVLKPDWDCAAEAAQAAPDQQAGSSSTEFQHPLSKRVYREALSKSHSVAELNRVRDGKNTTQAITTSIAMDSKVWGAHLQKNLNKKGQLWLIKLSH